MQQDLCFAIQPVAGVELSHCGQILIYTVLTSWPCSCELSLPRVGKVLHCQEGGRGCRAGVQSAKHSTREKTVPFEGLHIMGQRAHPPSQLH